MSFRLTLLNLFLNPSLRFATSVILQVAYGFRLEDSDTEYIDITAGVSHALGNCGSGGGTPIDIFPFCQSPSYRSTVKINRTLLVEHMPSWFPGTYYANFARACQKYVYALHDVPYERVEKDMVRPVNVCNRCALS
jgi:hypothetical protein